MLYGKETLILEEVKSTFLSNEIRKRPNQIEQEGTSLVAMGRKEREGKKSQGLSKASLLSIGRSLEGLQAPISVIEEERAKCESRRSRECIGYQCVNDFHRSHFYG